MDVDGFFNTLYTLFDAAINALSLSDMVLDVLPLEAKNFLKLERNCKLC